MRQSCKPHQALQITTQPSRLKASASTTKTTTKRKRIFYSSLIEKEHEDSFPSQPMSLAVGCSHTISAPLIPLTALTSQKPPSAPITRSHRVPSRKTHALIRIQIDTASGLSYTLSRRCLMAREKGSCDDKKPRGMQSVQGLQGHYEHAGINMGVTPCWVEEC